MRFWKYNLRRLVVITLLLISCGFHALALPGHSLQNDAYRDNEDDLDWEINTPFSRGNFQENHRSKEIPNDALRWLDGSVDGSPKEHDTADSDVPKSPADHFAENITGTVPLNFMTARQTPSYDRLHAEGEDQTVDALKSNSKTNKRRLQKNFKEKTMIAGNQNKKLVKNYPKVLRSNTTNSTKTAEPSKRRGNLVMVPHKTLDTPTEKKIRQHFSSKRNDPRVMSGGGTPFVKPKIVILKGKSVVKTKIRASQNSGGKRKTKPKVLIVPEKSQTIVAPDRTNAPKITMVPVIPTSNGDSRSHAQNIPLVVPYKGSVHEGAEPTNDTLLKEKAGIRTPFPISKNSGNIVPEIVNPAHNKDIPVILDPEKYSSFKSSRRNFYEQPASNNKPVSYALANIPYREIVVLDDIPKSYLESDPVSPGVNDQTPYGEPTLRPFQGGGMNRPITNYYINHADVEGRNPSGAITKYPTAQNQRWQNANDAKPVPNYYGNNAEIARRNPSGAITKYPTTQNRRRQNANDALPVPNYYGNNAADIARRKPSGTITKYPTTQNRRRQNANDALPVPYYYGNNADIARRNPSGSITKYPTTQNQRWQNANDARPVPNYYGSNADTERRNPSGHPTTQNRRWHF